jgi:hypothetical protein
MSARSKPTSSVVEASLGQLTEKCVADLRNICYTFCYAVLKRVGRAEAQSGNEMEGGARLRFSNG